MAVRIVLSDITLADVQAEACRALAKHGVHAMVSPDMTTTERLAILGEEFGEVCKVLTYDSGEGKEELRKELVQLAAMAASWVEALDNS